ncbi:protein N-terminal glutamine amidohydrolase [Elysia marginata]|uniref:Protein N-terminal glutamine amidohydrolase n=1 Tax=Elysia marginata TaxID=1093978 RepID=A0AAV4G7Y3_9GAST|nr:protein N-terminal glutamine amidohydrolase [Elysia marginata]
MALDVTDQSSVPNVVPEAFQCIYTACYCEENVWKLAAFVKENCSLGELSKCYCVFISNKSKKIPLWQQKASRDSDGLVVWDYHVIFVYQEGLKSLVFDLDTKLSFPCTMREYATACIGDEKTLKQQYKRMFRVIPVAEFLSTFASDRSHMINEKGEWLSPPPKYPPISCSDSTNNIEEFISMSEDFKHGKVLHLSAFLEMFKVET